MRTWSPERQVRILAAEAGGADAILDADGVTTWADLDTRSDAAAAAVRSAGVVPGNVVAVIAEPSSAAIAVLLGTLRVGAVAAPVPTRLSTAELAAALRLLEPALVLHETEQGIGVAAAGCQALAIDAAVTTPFAALSGAPTVSVADRSIDPEAPAVIVLTAGTTGRPKGVVLSGRAMAASAASWLGALPPATGWLLALGMGHVAGLGVVWRAIAGRVPVRIVAAEDPAAQLEALGADPAPSHVSLVPVQLARLLDLARDAPAPPTLRAVLLGGGFVPAPLVERAVRAGWPVMPTYGLSEAGSGVTALASAEALAAPGTAGRPLPGIEVRIADPDETGVGEIVVDGPASFSGYLGEPPRAPGDAVRTGDLGYLDDAGRLVVVDRRTDRIVRGGENIAPAEVEAVLLAHPAVADAAVVGRPDPTWGHVPVAAIVLRAGAEDPGDDALTAHARAALAGFKVPVAFLRLDTLPRTSGGKLRRDAVRAFVAGDRAGELARPGGDAIGWRLTGAGALPVVLLHGTLSTAAQLDRLAAELARPGDVTVHALDRRGSGTGRLVPPRPLDVSVHVADLVAYLDARGIGCAVLVGASFGGVLALETAARHPDRVAAVVAYEPPYGSLADPATVVWFRALAAATAAAHHTGGAPAAAETFLRVVAGDAAWDRLPPRTRAFLEREGDGALADAGLSGLDPDGLARITAPVAILTGGASEPLYAPIADSVAALVPGARRDTLPGLTHPAPITEPVAVAAAIRACLELPA